MGNHRVVSVRPWGTIGVQESAPRNQKLPCIRVLWMSMVMVEDFHDDDDGDVVAGRGDLEGARPIYIGKGK